MVNNTEAIKSFQDTTGRHDQILTSFQAHVSNQEQWNTNTQSTLQEMIRQLQAISHQLGISATTSTGGKLTTDSVITRGKAKVRYDSDDIFSFSPRPVQVELPVFNGNDPEEWLPSANDFFQFYGTEDHHRVTMASF
ncbi:hypothetical protein PVK06_046654 [Gossypium arboreum]|uniref:Uncharacterized protein n=1 Tax=Gossypium arboreum TaxID=29729 RepID=A0ABR0MBA3_GOSAR|nr:hypothetical protein PVK06_046654 [Gossypium arboreum]